MRPCPDCGNPLKRTKRQAGNAIKYRYFCTNQTCHVIEVGFMKYNTKRIHREPYWVVAIKREAVPRKVPLSNLTLEMISENPEILEEKDDE